MTTPDPATSTRISATHSSSWRGLRIGIICLRSGVICPILGARGKRSLFKSPSRHHAQRDRSRNWSIKTAICVVSLRVFFLPASTCDVPHETFVAGLPPRRLDGNLCPSRAAIALGHRPEKSLASQLRQKRLEVYCTNTISETPSRECRRDTGEAREPKLVVSPRPISRRIPFALLVLSGYPP